MFEWGFMMKNDQLLEVVQFSALSCMAEGLLACAQGAAFDYAFEKAFADCGLGNKYPLAKLSSTPSHRGEREPSVLIERVANRRVCTLAEPTWGFFRLEDGRYWFAPWCRQEDDMNSYWRAVNTEKWVEERLQNSWPCERDSYRSWADFGHCFVRYFDPGEFLMVGQ